MSRWLHMAHLNDTPVVKAGQYVNRGDLLGYRGNTGNSTGPHTHFEVRMQKPPTWHFYPVGWSKIATKNLYQDPRTTFLKDGLPVPFDHIGYEYLQYENNVWHPGLDLDGPIGTPVKAPCNGRVQFVEGKSWLKNWLGKLIPQMYNGGWGCHLYIEVDEVHPGL